MPVFVVAATNKQSFKNKNSRAFSTTPVLRYPDGGDDLWSFPNPMDDGHYYDGGPLDSEGCPMTPFRSEVEKICPIFNSRLLQSDLSDDNCKTRSQYLFNSAANQTVDCLIKDFQVVGNEYMEAKRAYDKNVYNQSH